MLRCSSGFPVHRKPASEMDNCPYCERSVDRSAGLKKSKIIILCVRWEGAFINTCGSNDGQNLLITPEFRSRCIGGKAVFQKSSQSRCLEVENSESFVRECFRNQDVDRVFKNLPMTIVYNIFIHNFNMFKLGNAIMLKCLGF